MIDILQRSIAEMRMLIQGERNTLRQKMVDFYQSAQTSENEYLRKYFGEREALPLITEDLTKRVIDRISMVYKKPPMRYLTTADGTEIDNDGIGALEQDYPDYHTLWKEGERYGNLLHNVLLRFEYDVELGKYCFFLDYNYIPHFHVRNALLPMAYSILLPQDTEAKTASSGARFLFVSDEEIFIHDEHGTVSDELEGGVNPYGIMPVVDLSRFAVGDYWQMGAKPLVEANQILNVAQLEMFYGLVYQATDQAYSSGIDPSDVEKLKRTPDRLWAANDPDATFGLLGFSPKLVESTEALERYIGRVLTHYGLSASFKDDGDVMSGVALQIKNLDLLEKRTSDIDHFRVKEAQAFNILREMNRVQGTGYNMPDGAELKIDFSEVAFPTDPAEVRADWQWKIQNNFARPEDYLMSQNPDLDEAAATKQLADNRAANAINKQRGGGLFRQLTQQDEEGEDG